jgi:betaine-aldehyde dehydrogenase
MSVHEPMGVVAAITPWNSPIASEAQKMAPALAAPWSSSRPSDAADGAGAGQDLRKAGVPKGMISVLPGKGSVIGDAITKHPLVKRVSFTGGTTTGKHIAHIAADKMMPVSLELGGKSATMVLEDADLDHAVNGVLYGIFSSSGESCIAGSRLFVARGIYDEFMERLAAAAEPARGRPGRRAHPDGSADHRQAPRKHRALCALGVSEGGRCAPAACAPGRASTRLLLHARPSSKA